MSKLMFGMAACVTLLCSSQGLAGFTTTGPVMVKSLGTVTIDDTTVNKFVGGVLQTHSSASHVNANPSLYTDTLTAGKYAVFLVNGKRTDTPFVMNQFLVEFSRPVLGVVASNAALLNFSVWDEALSANLDLMARVLAGLADRNFNPYHGSFVWRNTTVLDLTGDSLRALEIVNNSELRDAATIQFDGNHLQYTVNNDHFLWGAEMTMVFTAIPEPTLIHKTRRPQRRECKNH
jgi:hypothetical protein